MALLRQYEIIIASSVVLLLVLFLSVNILLPNLNQANQILAQEKNLKNRVDLLTAKYKQLNSMDDQYFKDVFVKLNQVFPESKDYVSLIGTFDILEKQSGASIEKTDFQLGAISTTSSSFVKAAGVPAFVVPLNIEIVGNLETVRKFLDAVGDFTGRLIVFDDMSMTIKPSGLLDIVFNGRAFFYPLPTTIGSIDSPLPKMEKSQEDILSKVSTMPLIDSGSTKDFDKSNIGKKTLFE